MLQRDYFIRIIEEFTAALARFLEKKVDERRNEDLEDLYRQYVGDYTLLRNMTVDEAIAYANEQWDEDRRIDKLEMLASLLYAEGSYKQQPMRDMLLNKAFAIYDYVDENSRTLSLDRRNTMTKIKDLLKKDK